jgi:hypothetical protein
MSEEYSGTIRVGDKIYPTGGDWHAEANVEMHAPSVFEFLQSLGTVLRESAGPMFILSGKGRNLLLRHDRRMNEAKRWRKIRRKQKRVAFRRKKQGLT